MKKHWITLFTVFLLTQVKAQNSFDIFSYEAPAGFTLKENKAYLFYSKIEGKNYCQLFLYPADAGLTDVEKDFETNWNFFARNPDQKVADPETKELDSLNGWQMIMGAARGAYKKQMFAITVSTFSKDSISYYVAAVFTDKKFIPIAQEFIASIVPDESKFVRTTNKTPSPELSTGNIEPARNNGITKFKTTFNDGWNATVMPEYVQVIKADTEVRLHYVDKDLDDAAPNTVESQEYYWSKYVAPHFNISNPQKWSGIEYPVIYFMEADAVDKKTGRQLYVTIKVVYGGGARPIVILAPDRERYWQQFPHPNDVDKMLNYNKFAVSAADLIGTWKGGGGGGVEYYNVYTGNYAGMSSVSSSDEFVFTTDGNYNSKFRSAVTNNGATQFGSQDFAGKFSVTDWIITASNRYGGKTTKFNAQFSAVKNGCLLFMSDSEYSSMNYTLFKIK